MSHKKSALILLAAIVILSIALRFYMLGSIPVALNRDEAALGYNAWSILHTGRDEHGVYFPVNLQSFGDWKLPLYVYALIPLISVFGLNEWSTRLLSALAGVSAVLLTYFICKLLIADRAGRKKVSTTFHALPLLAALFVAISPWSLHMSRIAYEANLALAICAGGLLLFLTALHAFATKKSSKLVTLLLTLSAILFGLTLFTYHSYQIFTPLFCLGLLGIYRQEVRSLWHTKKSSVLFPLFTFLFFLAALLFSQTSGANSTKYGGISIFSESQYTQTLYEERVVTDDLPPLLSKLYVSMPRLISYKLLDNIVNITDPAFLFETGGAHDTHNFPGVGNLYWFGLLTVPVGLFYCISKRERLHVVLLLWIAAAVVAPLITIDAAHSIRFSPALIPLEIVSALGVLILLKMLVEKSKILWYVGVTGVSLVIIYSFFVCLISYFVVFPVVGLKAWPYYMKPIVEHATNPAYADSEIYMQGERSSPYIWMLFYHPELYQASDITYAQPENGFVYAQKLRNITFGDIDWEAVTESTAPSLFIVRPNELNGKDLSKVRLLKVDEITLPPSEDQFIVFEKVL